MPRILTLAALLASLALPTFAYESHNGHLRLVYYAKTDRGAELKDGLDVTEGTEVLFTLPLPSEYMVEGNLICARGILRGTNNSGSNLSFSAYIYMAKYEDIQETPIAEADKLVQRSGENVPLSVHHGSIERYGCKLIESVSTNRTWLNFTAAVDSTDKDAHYRIDPGLGHMEYRIYEPVPE